MQGSMFMVSVASLVSLGLAATSPFTYSTAYYDPSTSTARIVVGLKDLTGGDAVVSYSPSMFENGWNQLHVRARNTSLAAAYSAGYAEGYVTQKSIFSVFQNMYAEDFVNQGDRGYTPTEAYEWLLENYAWTKATAALELAKNQGTDLYWGWVAATIDQLDGLLAGYNAAAPADQQLTLANMLLLNADGDLESLQDAFAKKSSAAAASTSGGQRRRGLWHKGHKARCSSMWKVTEGNADILFGHATWDSFDAMVRTLKTYTWGGGGSRTTTATGGAGSEAVSITMSSTPAFLSSVDDFYLTSRGLAVIETTNGNYNASLWAQLTPKSVLSWVRVNVANAAAGSAPSWASLFGAYNSGTYNNQWMVLDMNAFVPGQPLQPNTFLILEQLPGLIAVEDKSAYLQQQRYWASYNIPAIPEVWRLSGFGSQSPAWSFSHATAPRALMMARLNATVVDLPSYQRLIRYNEFGRDSNPRDAWAGDGISSRFDLLPKSSSNYFIFGGIDGKATSVQEVMRSGGGLQFWAQNGPTHDSVPPFNWNAAGPFPNPRYKASPVHVGMPDLWDFDWVSFSVPSWEEEQL